MECSYCGKKYSKKGVKYHERYCEKNANRCFLPPKSEKYYESRKTGNFKNGYSKAKEEGREYILSPETRKKLSQNSTRNNLCRTSEIQKKISNGMKQAHAEGRAWNIGKSRWNNEPSWPEKFFRTVIENEFDDKNVIVEHAIGVYSADFCWQHKRKVIEIDGDQHYRFQECIDRDRRKDAYLQSLGYKVLRIRWKDMCKDTKTWIGIAKKFIDE